MRRTLSAIVRWPFSSPGPTVALEIAPRCVTAVAVDRRTRGSVIAAHATEALPDGAVVPAVNTTNITDPEAVTGAIRTVFERLGRRSRRLALVVPDSIAKVSIVRFEQAPARAPDLEQLIRWQVRKTAPFRIEDAQMTYSSGAVTDEGHDFVVALTRRDIVEEYERVCTAAGAHAGIVDLASFDLINAVLAAGGPQGDWLLVHVTPVGSTIAIVRGADLIFFRNRPAEGDGHLTDLVHQTAMYYEDRLGGSRFQRLFIVGATGPGGDAIRRGLESRLGARVEPVDPRPAAPLADRISATADVLDQVAAPVGLLLRDRVAS